MSKENNKISIVIPIYNVEKYLKRCLDLILNYIDYDYELILVNDGSTDNCASICKAYEKSNTNIKVINKKNGGLSSARNAGIDVAQGKYIVFIDPDDEIDKDYFNKLYTVAEENNCDVVVSGYEIVPGNKVITPGYKLNTLLSGKEFILSATNIHTNNDLCFVWRNIYKLDVIKSNNIRFNEDVFIGEDVIFNLEFFLNSKRAYAIDKGLYYYTVNNPNSLMRVMYKPKLESSLMLQYDIRNKLSKEYNLLKYKHYKIDMANYYIKNIYTMIIINLKNGSQENIKDDIKRIINYPMFKDSSKALGLSYKCENIKEYIYYLALKYRIGFFIYKIYERECSK